MSADKTTRMHYFDLRMEPFGPGVLVLFEREGERPHGEVIFFDDHRDKRAFDIAFAANFQAITGRPLFGSPVDFVVPRKGGRARKEGQE